MINKLNTFILTLILLITSGLFAQKLGLEDCLRMADTANVSIRNALLDIEINDKNRSAYLSARLPQLTFSGDYKYNAIIPGQVVPAAFFGGPPGTFATVQFGVPYTLSNSLQLTQILFNPQLEYGLAALKINEEIVGLQHKLTLQDVRYQVASTFFNLQAVKKQLIFVDGNIKNMDKLITNMEALIKQGMVIQTELDKLSISRLTLSNTASSLKATNDQLEALLKILIGMDPATKVELMADETVESSILVDASTISYPELDLISAQQKMNREEHKGNNMAYLPSVSLYAAYNYNYNMKPEDDFRTGIEGAFVGLRVDWKLFDGLEKMHKQHVNVLNSEKLSNQKELVTKQLELKASNAKRQIEVQTNALALAKEQLKLAQNIYDQASSKLSLGTISSNDLITADNGLQQAQTNLVSAYIQLRQAEVEYLRSIGNLK
ncbi:MAG: TolC family protein [Cryomorphaceae bacterium]|nr:TolC family protein [Cryomorphaceae bacterium]